MHYRKKKLQEELGRVEMAEEEMQNGLVTGDKEMIKKRQIQLVNQRLLLDQAQDKIWLECMRPQHDSFPEYIQAVVQFAYVSCFSVVLPITPLICLINYLVQMRLDAYKVCKVRRRPLAEKTGGIGVWEHLLHIVVVIAVLTNCWLMGFTHSQFLWIGEKVGTLGQVSNLRTDSNLLKSGLVPHLFQLKNTHIPLIHDVHDLPVCSRCGVGTRHAPHQVCYAGSNFEITQICSGRHETRTTSTSTSTQLFHARTANSKGQNIFF